MPDHFPDSVLLSRGIVRRVVANNDGLALLAHELLNVVRAETALASAAGNPRNLTTEWPRAQLRVVVDGSAVTASQGENNFTRALGEMTAAGVTVQVCPNALRDHSIAPETVASFAQVSLGGVVALVLAHNEGYV